MTAAISADVPLIRVAEKPPQTVRLLQVFSIALMALPAFYVVKVIGATGYAASLVSYLMFAVWLSATILGHHNPSAYRYPLRITLVGLWAVSLSSYAVMNRDLLTATQLESASRWLLQMIGISGIVLMAAEGLPTLEDVRRVLRALTWGGAFCGIVAALQFKSIIDLTKYLRLPGFAVNAPVASNAAIVVRGAQNRVPGTATDPIELGVSAAMLLALAVYLLKHDKSRPMWQRVIPVVCLTMGIAASVSRSGIIAVVIVMLGLIGSSPAVRRLKILAMIPVALAGIFVLAHGLIGTLRTYFSTLSTDPSIAHRTNNYPYVIQLVREAPWLGTGGGTYIPALPINILDNEYLTTTIELGLLGLLALVFYLVWPVVAALTVRRLTADAELRDLCAAMASAEIVAVVCSAFFDGLSFPIFYSLQALIAGLIGAVWMIVNREKDFVPEYRDGGSRWT